jgi:hypothetical protein
MLWFTFKVKFGTIPAGWVGGWLAGWLAGKELVIRLSSAQLELALGLVLGNKNSKISLSKKLFGS